MKKGSWNCQELEEAGLEFARVVGFLGSCPLLNRVLLGFVGFWASLGFQMVWGFQGTHKGRKGKLKNLTKNGFWNPPSQGALACRMYDPWSLFRSQAFRVVVNRRRKSRLYIWCSLRKLNSYRDAASTIRVLRAFRSMRTQGLP